MITKQKLNFQPAVMNYQNVYLAEPYKVTPYEFRIIGNIRIDKPSFAAYYRIKSGNQMLFGNSCEHDSNGYTKFYDTKEEAIEACQKHLDSITH